MNPCHCVTRAYMYVCPSALTNVYMQAKQTRIQAAQGYGCALKNLKQAACRRGDALASSAL